MFDFFASVLCVGWVLMTKSEASSAIAWILLIFFVPLVWHSALLLLRLSARESARCSANGSTSCSYERPTNPPGYDSTTRLLGTIPRQEGHLEGLGESIARLACRLGGCHLTDGNQIDFYSEGEPAFAAMIEAIRAARHHVHLLVFIYQPDRSGAAVSRSSRPQKAKEGVEVRLLYDAMGSHRLTPRLLRPLHEAGGKTSLFLPINLLRRRLQINMRNHRKIMVVDGTIGFIGGLNIGDEYVGKNKYFGFWRDTHMRLRGPAGRSTCSTSLWRTGASPPARTCKTSRTTAYFTAITTNGPYSVPGHRLRPRS